VLKVAEMVVLNVSKNQLNDKEMWCISKF